MLKKQNGLDNKTEAALINKDIISEIINQNKGIDFAINSNVTFDAAKQNYKKVLIGRLNQVIKTKKLGK